MRTLVAIAVASLLTVPSVSTAQNANADVMTVVQKFIDGFNKGDVNMMSTACAEQTAIVDEFPPHAWQGPKACERWAADWDADAKKNGITDAVVTIAKPTHLDVAGEYAYIVVPADYAYKLKGKPVKEVGSILTLALRKAASGWRVTGWSWAKH